MYMKYAKTRDVKDPVRANPSDAIDIFIPNDFEAETVYPGTNIFIPSGLAFEVPFGYALIALNKSGIASKKELVVGACLIDHGYKNEIHIDLHNIGQDVNGVLLIPGMKITQLLLVPIATPTLLRVDNQADLYEDIPLVSSRNMSGFGSTGLQ